jgi:hypothetical protein
LWTSLKEGIGSEKRPKDRVKRQDELKENFNMLELSESLLWLEGDTTVTQDSTAEVLPTVRHFIFPIQYCPKLAPSTKGGGEGYY